MRALNLGLGFLCFLSVVTSAQPTLKSAKALKTSVENKTMVARLEAGFHFNDKAPNGIQDGTQFASPKKVEARLITLDLAKTSPEAVAHLYVCDDGLTFCDIHRVPLSKKTLSSPKPASGLMSILGPPKTDAHGFLLNDFATALNNAKKNEQNILVDFSARWCPACLRLESEILSHSEFQKKSENFIKVKLDVDVVNNTALATKFKVRGIPTILFLNSKGEEISRFSDFQPLADIVRHFDEVEQYPLPISQFEKSAKSASQKEVLARRHLSSGDYEKALVLFRSLSPRPKEYWAARVEGAETAAERNPTLASNFAKVLREALADENQTTRSLVWRQSLLELLTTTDASRTANKKEIDQLILEAQKLSQSLLESKEKMKSALITDQAGEFTGFESFYVASLLAEMQSLVETSKSQSAWKSAIQQGENLKISADQPAAALRLISAYVESNQWEPALELITGLLKKNPENGDWLARQLSLFVKMKKYKEAVTAGESALPRSYGLNEFSVAANLAEAYLGVGEKQKAKEVSEAYLKRNEINFKKLARAKDRLEAVTKLVQAN